MKKILLPLLAFVLNTHSAIAVGGEDGTILVETKVVFGVPSDELSELCDIILTEPFKTSQGGYWAEVRSSAQANCVKKLSQLKTYSVVSGSDLMVLAN